MVPSDFYSNPELFGNSFAFNIDLARPGLRNETGVNKHQTAQFFIIFPQEGES